MPTALPTQITGAQFLAARTSALLADEPRVGKTGAALMACDLVDASKIQIVTTATNRFNMARDVLAWQQIDRSVSVAESKLGKWCDADVIVMPWSLVSRHAQGMSGIRPDVLIVDESHYAKSIDAARTAALYGNTLAAAASRVWLLSGTPIPNSPLDLYPALYALERHRLEANDAKGWPDVRAYGAFRHRYCEISVQWFRGERVEVIKGGKNEAELRDRLDGWWMRRTQKEVGIRPPDYDTLLLPPARIPREALDFDTTAVLEAAEAGKTGDLDTHLGTLRRLTGGIKAEAVAAVVAEEFACGLDCVVLMCWHQDTMRVLAERLASRGVVALNGASTPREREHAQHAFQDGRANVFIGQILAAGEAIDLSRSAELIFVEPSFVPSHMSQAALRITNHSQQRNCRVRVAALAGSIDEAVTKILVRKVASIVKVLGKREAA